MKLAHRYAAVFLFMLVAQGCAVTGNLFGPSPEAQIVNGANTVTAATTLATVLLKNDRISVTQAKGYRSILGTAAGHLDAAGAVLLNCRSATGSTSATKPDPCAASIEDDIRLAVAVAGEVTKTLKEKQ